MKDLTIITLSKKDITNFAEERNKLLKNAKTDWVLFLDSDEKLTKELENEIESKIQKTNFDGFYIKRKNYFLKKYVGTYKIIRLGKKNAGLWKRGVHETWNIKNVGLLENNIVHNTADNLSSYIKKINNYSNLHAKENLKEGKVSTLFKIFFFSIGKFVVTLIKSKNIVFSIMQSLHSYLAWTKLYFLQH